MSIQGNLVQVEMEPIGIGAAVYPTGDAPGPLKQQVAERLAAHRARRSTPDSAPNGPVPISRQGRGRAAEIAATVAERYANSPSYRAFLAAEAEEAIRRAEAAAEVAAVTAKAVAAAQYNLIAELDETASASPSSHTETSALQVEVSETYAPAAESSSSAATTCDAATQPHRYAVRLYDQIAIDRRLDPGTRKSALRFDEIDEDEVQAMDEEIAFRHAPAFQETVREEIAANLIEFPRQLIAARKARPRLAEGPLREGTEAQPGQLRIFEVQPEHISSVHAAPEISPGWSSIVLGAQPAPQFFDAEGDSETTSSQAHIERARLPLRIMAAGVDICIVVAGALLFSAAGIKVAGALPDLVLSPRTAAGGFAAVLLLFWAIYEVLCLTLSNATAGMRYARIGLCTFREESPTRRQRVRRLLALAASIAPLGLGLLWVWVDPDGLTGHDRISGMYLRGY